VSAEQTRRGRFYEDFEVGAVYRSALGRTITETDNVWFTTLTLNTNQLHFNAHYAAGSTFGELLVNSTFTLALVVGLSVPDTSENASANLGWEDVRLPKPVLVGDTLWAETEVLDKRESQSNSGLGIVRVRTRGINQRSEVVIEYTRSFLIPLRASQWAADRFPQTDEAWRVE
jgi:acyl dehydratase